jgi:hypothetical protein
VCSTCYSRDPVSRKQCSKCGRFRPRAQRLADGGVLCPTCAPPRIYTCSGCGQRRPAPYVTSEGRICTDCYAKAKTVWVCGLCGVTRRRQSGSILGPHLCGTCRAITTTTYSGIRSPHSKSICAFCRQRRVVARHWPAGPICTSCLGKAKMYPSPCAACGQHAVLIGFDPARRRICGPCSGAELEPLRQLRSTGIARAQPMQPMFHHRTTAQRLGRAGWPDTSATGSADRCAIRCQ